MKVFVKMFFIHIGVLICACSGYAEQAQLGIIITTGENNKGCFSWIQERKYGPTRPAKNNIMPTIADIHASSNGQYYYILEGAGINRVSKFDISTQDNPKPIWQYSSQLNTETNTLPIDILFIQPNKAYLLRYASPQAWIINPSAPKESEFHSGDIDLSSYTDNDGSPEMTCGIVVGDKAFIVLKRMDTNNQSYQQAYLAVIDTKTNLEIDTHKDQNQIGIPLIVKNPVSIHYIGDTTNKLYVLGTAATNTFGGIEEIDPDAYTSTVILDGASQKYFTEMVLLSHTDGFILAASTPEEQTLCHLNLKTRTIENIDFNTINSGYMKSKKLKGMALDQHDRLWIGNQTERTVVIINSTPNGGLYQSEEDVPIPKNEDVMMKPEQITFCMEPQTTDNDESQKPSSSGESGNFCFIEVLR